MHSLYRPFHYTGWKNSSDEYTANLQPLLYTLGQIITNTVNGLDFYQVDRSGGLIQTEI